MLAAGFFLLRAKTCEPAGKLLFFLYLAVQVQFICHNVTFYIYNIWFAGMLQWEDVYKRQILPHEVSLISSGSTISFW